MAAQVDGITRAKAWWQKSERMLRVQTEVLYVRNTGWKYVAGDETNRRIELNVSSSGPVFWLVIAAQQTTPKRGALKQ